MIVQLKSNVAVMKKETEQLIAEANDRLLKAMTSYNNGDMLHPP